MKLSFRKHLQQIAPNIYVLSCRIPDVFLIKHYWIYMCFSTQQEQSRLNHCVLFHFISAQLCSSQAVQQRTKHFNDILGGVEGEASLSRSQGVWHNFTSVTDKGMTSCVNSTRLVSVERKQATVRGDRNETPCGVLTRMRWFGNHLWTSVCV